ncbi:hypothetical protein CUMW_263710 [Citrus unshiu]|uniref:UspA domain-containing protein n=1 Tax=Citrus unshiu TaxID=55188 RepID=A0A2H5QUY4_CITUN|nr:hypothetical protein CUMW_263710 [Citrus unshiu]
MATAETQTMVVGIDDSEHSMYALQWTLDHFFANSTVNPPFKLVIVHAKPSPSSVVGLAGPGAAEVLPYVDSDLKKIAARVVEKAKEICSSKSVMISLAVLGSVSDYCAHHAHCTVMIVKRPKTKH